MCAWTYSGNPNASKLDETHFLLGDVDPSSPVSTDEECLYALTKNRGNALLAAADVAETKAMQFAWRPTMIRRGDRWVSYAEQSTAFKTMAATLRMRASLATTTVYAGGLSYSEKDSAIAERDLVKPFVTKDLQTPPLLPRGVASADLSREDL